MLAELLSAVLRGLSFIAMAQAAGAVLFLILSDSALGTSRRRIVRLGAVAVAWSLLLLPAQFALEAARMAGSLSGALDIELQRFALSTSAATVLAVRMAGSILLATAAAGGAGALLRFAGLPGVALMAASFALTGHTTMAPTRWLLGSLLVVHVLAVFFWFGALRPLMQVVAAESATNAAQVVERFSRIALMVVPMILLAGLIMAVMLLPDAAALRSAYGMGLIAKLLAFAVLMLLAARNKWRLGPALATGAVHARQQFTRTVALEAVIIAMVLIGTASLTTFFSPS